jgi:predicted phage tail protein
MMKNLPTIQFFLLFHKMTKIYIKGILGKKFGNYFSGFVKDVYSALKLIDANKNGFFKCLMDFNKENMFYSIICDGKIVNDENDFLEKRKINKIYIIPIVVGSGEAVAIAIGLTAGTAGAAVVAGVVNVIISTVVSLGISFIMNAINKQSSPQIEQQKIGVGGATAYIESKGRSYIFSNKQNTVSQGNSIPVGYGQMIIASNLIHASIKNYATNQIAQEEFKLFSSSSIFLDYMAQ